MRMSVLILGILLIHPKTVCGQDVETIGVGSSIGQIGRPGSEVYLGYAKSFASTNGDTIYVLDSQNSEILAFDQDGKQLFVVGRRGQGPGEFVEPSAILWSKGRLFVSDTRLNRVTVFKSAGEFNRTIAIAGRPEKLAAIGDRLYVGVVSGRAIVIEIDLEHSDEQSVLVTYDSAELSETPMPRRLSQPILQVLGNRLYVGLPNLGRILEVESSRITRVLEPTNQFTEAYWQYLTTLANESEEGGTAIPRVFEGITVWQDRFLLIQFRDRGGEIPSTVVVFDPLSGAEAGPRIVAASRGFFHLSELSNGLFAWALNGEGLVYLFNFSDLETQYREHKGSRLMPYD